MAPSSPPLPPHHPRPAHQQRPSLSISLPPSFEFHYNDGQLPKTPEPHGEPPSAAEPPPPPRPHTFKVRRRRAAIPEFHAPPEPPLAAPSGLSPDAVIPTIEMSEAGSEMSSPVVPASTPSLPTHHGLLAPVPASMDRLVASPKTPAPRTRPPGFHSSPAPADHAANEWALITDSRHHRQHPLRPAFERAGSVCSSFSDSSISSCGSSDFSAPVTGSCASPDSEATDPFVEDDLTKAAAAAAAPLVSPDSSDAPRAKRVKTHRHVKWTQAMDEHLWLTYMTYLSDPRVTPFKMLPGTVPPLGLCTRVAARARRTWSAHRASSPGGLDALTPAAAIDRMQREGSPDTIRPDTPAARSLWPRSDSATRRRLRTLCKRRPSLPSYYHRLLRTRSPSPFASSSSSTVAPSSEPPAAAPFSSRDMNISLTAATAPSMQPEGPLARLAHDHPAPAPRPESSSSQRGARPADWFARIPRSQAHQKSLSLQSGLSLNAQLERSHALLASPFDDAAHRTHLLESMSATKSLGRTSFNTKDVTGPSLDSPVELSGAPTLPRSLKRRFKSDEEKPKRPALQDVFGPHADDGGIVRNRGFTVGAFRATDNLAKLFQPPPPPPPPQPSAAAPAPAPSLADQEMAEAPSASSGIPELSRRASRGPPGSHSAPRGRAEQIPRLGSPFTEAPPANRPFNTFPRSSYIPSASNPQPFQQRLRELAAHGAANQPR